MASGNELIAKFIRIMSESSSHDLVLIAGADPNKQKFPVQWRKIAAASDFFKTMAKPENCAEFTVPKVSGPTLEMVIDYCYRGHINLTMDNIGAVTTAASLLRITNLTTECAQFSRANLNAENDDKKRLPLQLPLMRIKKLNEAASLTTHSIDGAIERFGSLGVGIQNIYGAFSTTTTEGTIVQIQKYNVVANKWESFKTATFETPMQDHGLAVVGDKIFAMGGQTKAAFMQKAENGADGDGLSTKAWSYNMSTGKIMKSADLHHGRSHFTPVVVGNCIYIIGGRESKDGRDTRHTDARYYAALDVWKTYNQKVPSWKIWSSIAVDGEIFLMSYGRFYYYHKNREYESMVEKCPLADCGDDGVLAATKHIIYAIRGDGEVYQYDDTAYDYYNRNNKWTKVGALKNGEIILRTINYNGEMYAIYKVKKWGEYRFGKITIAPQNCSVIPLTSLPGSMDSSSILFLR